MLGRSLFCESGCFRSLYLTENNALIVLSVQLEVALSVVANGANLGSSFSDDDVSAVGALPNAVAVA